MNSDKVIILILVLRLINLTRPCMQPLIY